MWWVYALLSALFAALTAILSKIVVGNINSNLATALRTSVILVITWLIVLIQKQQEGLFTITKKDLVLIALSGVATGLSWLFYFKALQLGKISQVVAVDKLSVALAILLSILFLKETVTAKTVIGAVLIVAGTVVIIK